MPSDFPTCRFDLLGYLEAEEYAFQNEDYYGPDPDIFQVQEDLLLMKREHLEPFMIELEWFNKQLAFHHIDVRETSAYGCEWIDLEVVDMEGKPCGINDYRVDAQSVRRQAREFLDPYMVDGLSDKGLFEQVWSEAVYVLTWLQDEPPKCGFIVDVPKRGQRNRKARS